MALTDRNIDAWFAETGRHLSLNASIQAIRIAAHRIREGRSTGPLPAYVVAALQDAEPRLRFAAVQAVAQARQRQLVPAVRSRGERERSRHAICRMAGACARCDTRRPARVAEG